MKRLFTYLLITLLVFNSGCHALRKKFIRKKKIEKEQAVYVDFKEYPTKPSRDAYIDYYIFVRGWLDELSAALKKGISYKRQRRAISEAIMNVEQIISFFNTEGKEEIYPIYDDLLYIRQQVEKAPNMSEVRRNSLIRRIEHLKRIFEKDFNYSDAEQWMS
ncbi:MAG: hypothetical protein K9L86_07650 [Candidatus Omnitrophica bacterium]|nr:hypothetical protein [Candidatus Omnitrophota bacterium]